ncbi:MAG: GAF domain-containing sensor histidine kinase [Pseudomonadota bacterium]
MSQKNTSQDNQLHLKRQVDVLLRVDSFMSTLTDLSQLLDQIMQESQYITDSEASSLALFDEKTKEFVFEIVLGEKDFETKQLRINYDEGIIGYVARTGMAKNIKDAYADSNFTPRVDRKTGFKTRSILAVPMIRRQRLIGVIEVLNKKNDSAFTDEDQSILEILAHQAAIAIENVRLYKENLEKERLASVGQGISGAAHCIKNILNLITLGSGNLELGIETNSMEIIKSSWQPLQKGCTRITELVMDMLSYSKDRAPELTSVCLNDLLQEILDMVRPTCGERAVELFQNFDAGVGTMMLDKNGIHRCIMNLITNALDAMGKKGGSISVKSVLDKALNEVEVQVADTGPGIPPESIDKVFEVFYSTKGSSGTGLGLAITKKIITEHGGSIAATSASGKGALFFIRLPVASTGKSAAPSR